MKHLLPAMLGLCLAVAPSRLEAEEPPEAFAKSWKLEVIAHRFLEGGPLRAIAWDPANRRLALLLPDGNIILRDLAAGKDLDLPEMCVGSWAHTVAFSKGGRTVWAAGSTVGAWDTETGAQVFSAKAVDAGAVDGGLEADLLVSGDGTRVAVMAAQPFVFLDAVTGKPIPVALEPIKKALGVPVALSPDGRRAMVRCEELADLVELDLGTGKRLRVLTDQAPGASRGEVNPCRAGYLPDGTPVVLTDDGTLLIGGSKTPLDVQVDSLATSTTGGAVLLRTKDGGARVIDAKGGTLRSLGSADVGGDQMAWGEGEEVSLFNETTGKVRAWGSQGVRDVGVCGRALLVAAALSTDGGTLALATGESVTLESLDGPKRRVLKSAGIPYRGAAPGEILLAIGARLERLTLADEKEPELVFDLGSAPDRLEVAPGGSACLARTGDELRLFRVGKDPLVIPYAPGTVFVGVMFSWSPAGDRFVLYNASDSGRPTFEVFDGSGARVGDLRTKDAPYGCVQCLGDGLIAAYLEEDQTRGVFRRLSIDGKVSGALHSEYALSPPRPWGCLDGTAALVEGIGKRPLTLVRLDDLADCGQAGIAPPTWVSRGPYEQVPTQAGREYDWVPGIGRLMQRRALDALVYKRKGA